MINDASSKGHLQSDMKHKESGIKALTFSLLLLHAQAGFLFQKEFLWGLSLIEGLYPPPLIRYYQMFCDKGGFCELGISSAIWAV